MHIYLLLTAGVYLLLGSLDSLWSTSIDLAHHYALVVRLSEFWNMPYSGDASLGEMNFYPRSSHLLAAIVGRFLGSPLLGMQVTTLLSIVVLWASLVSIVLSLPKKAGFVAALILSAALWVNRRYVHMELHGDEVIENFFYAQLVAQAFVIFLVALTLYAERRGIHPNLRYALLVAAIYVATGMHLLPALELLCFFIALVSVDFYRQGRLLKRDWRNAGLSLLMLLAACAALLLHPSFATMRSISSNNGGLPTHYIQSMGAFAAYSAAHLLVSCAVLWSWLLLDPVGRARYWLALKYTALFGLAIAGLCLLQVLALQLGHGSEYSVKKYIFALNTSLFMEFSLLATVLICRLKSDWLVDRLPRATSTALLTPVLTVMAYLCVTPATARLDTSKLVALEHQLLLQRDLSLPSLPGKFDYFANIDGLPPTATYMMSIGVFKSPRFASPPTSMPAWWMADWSHVGTLVTSANNALDQDPACRRGAPVNALVMLDGACIVSRFSTNPLIAFTTTHAPTPTCILTGFSSAEAIGTWSAEKTASLRCPVPSIDGRSPRTLEIDSSAFLDHVPLQRVSVGIKDQAPVEYRFQKNHPSHLIVLELPARAGPEIQIDFTLPDAISPRQLGLSQDARQLGLVIRTLKFQ